MMIPGKENHVEFAEILYAKSTVKDTAKKNTGTKTAQDKENQEGPLIWEKRVILC
jgi:hypothetical protein